MPTTLHTTIPTILIIYIREAIWLRLDGVECDLIMDQTTLRYIGLNLWFFHIIISIFVIDNVYESQIWQVAIHGNKRK